jgi:5S rRNA maturation endonuclease (ribonuclease M5)
MTIIQTMTQKKKYRSYSQSEIKAICDDLCDNLDVLCEIFELDCKESNKMLTMSCPIHGGDNPSALNLYHTGEDYRGNWVCRTHHCEEIFQPSIIGFLRGVLSVRENNWSQKGDETFPFNRTLEFALKILNKNIKDIKVKKVNKEKINFIKHIQTIEQPEIKTIGKVTKNLIRKTLQIPAKYYIDRGFSEKILDKYDVGLCDNVNKEMHDRIVVPVYNQDYTFMVGCTGRSIHEKCDKCDYYHNPSSDCVDGKWAWKHSKWKHNKSFKSKDHLYNIWFAKDYIMKSGTAIIVESPGNVWRLEEAGIHNSIAIFGTSLSDRQKMLLDCSGAMSLLVLLDSDQAGQDGIKKIQEKCSRTYNIKTIELPKDDIAEMTVEEIKNIITPEVSNV